MTNGCFAVGVLSCGRFLFLLFGRNGEGVHNVLFQFLGSELQVELSFQSDGNSARFFADHDGQAVVFLRHAECGAVAQPQRLGDVGVVRDGQQTTGGVNAHFRYDHGAVVEGRIFEEDIFDESLRNLRIDLLPRFREVEQVLVTLQDNQRPDFLFAHADAGSHERHDVFVIQAFVLAVSAQPSHEERGALGADAGEKLPDFFLKEHDECQSTDIDQAVEDATEQSHLEKLRNEDPNNDENQYAGEDVGRTGGAHQSVDIEEQQRDQDDVDRIFEIERERSENHSQ